jgi:hypothetical protein
MMRRVRTTLSLDEDVLSVARAVAAAEGVSLGEVVSRLARQGMTNTARVAEADLPFFKVPADAPPITSEMVRRALDEE